MVTWVAFICVSSFMNSQTDHSVYIHYFHIWEVPVLLLMAKSAEHYLTVFNLLALELFF